MKIENVKIEKIEARLNQLVGAYFDHVVDGDASWSDEVEAVIGNHAITSLVTAAEVARERGVSAEDEVRVIDLAICVAGEAAVEARINHPRKHTIFESNSLTFKA